MNLQNTNQSSETPPALASVNSSNTTENTALEVKQLSAGYKDVIIVKNFSIKVSNAQIVTIIGPNGAGKSTLLKAIFGAIPVISGRVFLNGQDVTGWSSSRLVYSGAGFVPQTNNIFESLSIKENLQMGGYIYKGDINARVDEIMFLFPELKRLNTTQAANLSGGQRQILAMARALIVNPSVLLLDEPTAALSPIARQEVFEKIKRIRDSQVSVVMVEQNALEALEISDIGCVMVSGEKVVEEPSKFFFDNKDIGRLFVTGNVKEL